MREITFYNPGKSFPSVSVTGETCELDCAHCKKKFLHGMIPATNPQDLVSTCASLWREGVSGVLVSGGCDREGRVPFFPEALSEIREKTGLILNLHTGFVDEANLAGLLRASPHYISFDIPTDHALKEIYGLPRRSEEYIESLSLLKRNNLNAVPHICLGLGASQTEDEGMLRRVSEVADGVVLNIVVPAFGTVFEGKPVDEKRIIEEFACARALFSRMTLGCMRPRRKRIEEEAPLFDGIVAPTRWARAAARSAGLTIKEKNTCCVVY